jgi:hypothetical protein
MLEANAQVPIHAHPSLTGNRAWGAPRLSENCCPFICAEFRHTCAGVKPFLRNIVADSGVALRLPPHSTKNSFLLGVFGLREASGAR